MPSKTSRLWLWLLLLYAGLAAGVTAMHMEHKSEEERPMLRMERHQEILEGEGLDPWVYRVATPHAAEVLVKAQATAGFTDQWAHERAYGLLRFLSLFAAFGVFHLLCRHWLTTAQSITATAMLAGLHGPAAFHYYFQPDSPGDLLAWLLAGWLTVSGRARWLFVVLPLATLNRETAVFAVAIHLLLAWDTEERRTTLIRTAALGALWAAVFLGLRSAIPFGGHALEHGLVRNLQINLTNGPWAGYFFAFFGALPLLVVEGWPKLPADLKRLILLMIPYTLLIVVYGRLREVRLMLPVAAVLLPAVMLTLQDLIDDETSAE